MVRNEMMVKSSENLRSSLKRIDGRGYKAYQDIEGIYDFGEFRLSIDHVQGDPFAAPSRVRAKIDQKKAGFPPDTFSGTSRNIALRDFLTRRFDAAARRYSRGTRGAGNSGAIAIAAPGQEVLERTSVFVSEAEVEARFVMGLPAFGRRIAARHAEGMFFDELPRIVRAALHFKSQNLEDLDRHVCAVEDADFLRDQLDSMELLAFVADGAHLPRASGVDARPLKEGPVIPFDSPASLRREVRLPNRGTITGMGIPPGVTLIVGGGYHGKSTLLNALELGVYNHIPGDGRELVVTDPSAVKIRAEDGRRIEKVDISPFITNLPFGRDTRAFSSEDASGSTSQAANIVEALEAGARLLLIDEDTSATNFMIRDHRMQELVAKEREPITPFIDKVRQLYDERGISTILVIGGSGDYFDVADRVICMVEYKPQDVSQSARAIARKYQAERRPEGGESFGSIIGRIPLGDSLDPSRGRRPVKIAARGLHTILFGRHPIDLQAVEQLVHIGQTRAIGDALHFASRLMDGKRTLPQVIAAAMQAIESGGLDVLQPYPAGEYAAFRPLELAAALNRLRTLRIT
jgi:predicted ABC-class ATPase